MWSHKIYAYLYTGISGIGTFSNLKCFQYMRKTFNGKGAVFNILADDSLATAVGTGFFFITNIISLVEEDFFKSKMGCAIHQSGLYLPIVLGPVSSLMISMCRFIHLRFPATARSNSEAIKKIVKCVMILASSYYMTFMCVDTYLEGKSYNFIELCLGHEYPNGRNKV